MEKQIPFMMFAFVLLLLIAFGCGSNATPEKQNLDAVSSEEAAPSGQKEKLLVGQWVYVAEGQDQNGNDLLDDAEKTKPPVPSGFDYFHFYANGKCSFNKELDLEGKWDVKMRNDKKCLLVYPSGMPENIPQEKKDDAAYRYNIVSLSEKKLLTYPVHSGGVMVEYKRL